jgi:transposase-like protein
MVEHIYERFPTNRHCLMLLEDLVWGGRPICPYCRSVRSTSTRDQHHCNECNSNYRVTVNTVFHGTHVPLQKWFLALAIILATDRRVSARRLGQLVELNRDTSWRLAQRIYGGLVDPAQRSLMSRITESIPGASLKESWT